MNTLQIGDKLPIFKANNQVGELIKSSDFKDKKLVLYFYPKDDTPGCTAEACDLRDNYTLLQKQGYQVLGVSCDSEKSHAKFVEKYKLPFDLLADEDKTIVNTFGVWGPKKFMGKTYDGINRTTFIINEKGIIEDIISKVDTKAHTSQIIK